MRIIRLSSGVRRVRTPAGVAFFHQPIGTPITETEYQELLRQRREARRLHPEGHPDRLRAERNVRQARKQRKVDVSTPEPPVSPKLKEPEIVSGQLSHPPLGQLDWEEKTSGLMSVGPSHNFYGINAQLNGTWKLLVAKQSDEDVLKETFDSLAEAKRAAEDFETTGSFHPKLSAESDPWKTDPGFARLKNGFSVTAFGNKGHTLSFHPSAPALAPRWFPTRKEAEEFAQSKPAAWRFDYEKYSEGKKFLTPNSVAKTAVTEYRDDTVVGQLALQAGEVLKRNYAGQTHSASVPIIFAYREGTNSLPETLDSIEASIRSQLLHQEQLVPDVIQNLRVTVTPDLKSRKKGSLATHQATYAGDSGHLRVTPGVFPEMNSDPSQPQSALNRARDIGWWVPTDPHWTMADNVSGHEVGHGVAARAFAAQVPRTRAFWDGFVRTIEQEIPDGVYGEIPGIAFKNGVGGVSEIQSSVSEWIDRYRTTLAALGSKYATHSEHELWAELWAEYSLSSNPRPLAKYYGDYVKRLIDEGRRE